MLWCASRGVAVWQCSRAWGKKKSLLCVNNRLGMGYDGNRPGIVYTG